MSTRVSNFPKVRLEVFMVLGKPRGEAPGLSAENMERKLQKYGTTDTRYRRHPRRR